MKYLYSAILTFLILGCSPKLFKSTWTAEISPATFTTRFETTKGTFDIEVQRKWSPKAADRFYQLVNHNYFDNNVFYRVVPKFVAQFGSANSAAVNTWSKHTIPDEEVRLSNTKGTLSFARSTEETRGTDLYINLGDNSRLDTLNYNQVKGFPAFGKVTQGMSVVSSIFSEYKESSGDELDLLYKNQNAYFKKFPKIDRIEKAYIIAKK